MFSNQGNQAGGKKKRNRSKANRNKNFDGALKQQAFKFINMKPNLKLVHGKSKFQAPHQDEPVDLTDDLAPNANVSQTVPGPTVENKLNFKFQKTVNKTPDWTKYQNNFKTISGASPERDVEEIQPEESQTSEHRWDQKTVDLINDTPGPSAKNPSDMFAMSPKVMQVVQEKLKKLPPGKKPIIMPSTKEPPVAVVNKNTSGSQLIVLTGKKTKPRVRPHLVVNQTKKEPTLRPIDIKLLQNQPFKPDPKMYSFPQANAANVWTPYDYPKGIPKSFLTKDNMAFNTMTLPPQDSTPMDPSPGGFSSNDNSLHKYKRHGTKVLKKFMLIEAYDRKKAGIPRSFLSKEQMTTPPQDSTPPLESNTVPEYQEQVQLDLPSWILPSHVNQGQPLSQHSTYQDSTRNKSNTPTFGQHEPVPDRPYSPSDVYVETAKLEEEVHQGSESPDILQSGQKRLSAFKRLGPLTKPKKPKLTINLLCNKEQAVREVVDETNEEQRYVPVHLRQDVLNSKDETVKKYLPFWPWKRNITTRKTVSVRFSKSVMILEQEQMEAGYEKDSIFIWVTVKGYPPSWTKEDVLDALLECVKGKSFIPCFIEFNLQECKFLVIRCRAALLAIHKVGFCIRKDDVELTVTISLTETGLNQIDLIPRLVLRKRLMMNYDGEKTLDLTGFFMAHDVSHFVYFPLNRVTNQVELIQLQSAVAWEHLTELNLSHNRITSLDGFDLQSTTPKLKHLDLSHNYLEKITVLLKCKELPLRTIKLEGNPLCHDYIDSAHYIKVLKMIFSELKEIDGVPLLFKGDLPSMKINYCPEDAVDLVEKFLETFFPLLEAAQEDRMPIENLYDKDAVLTVTFRYKLRYASAYRYFRTLFLRARNFEEGNYESVVGSHNITTLISKWPAIEHDRFATTVDVMYHDDQTTILRIGGILKLTAETLAEDEHLLSFTRNIVLLTRNGCDYKILNEMLHWGVVCDQKMQTAFNITTVRPKQLSLKLDTPPDEVLKCKLINIFVKLAGIDKKRGERCLEKKNWDLRAALDYFIRLLKLDDLSSLNPREETESVSQPQSS